MSGGIPDGFEWLEPWRPAGADDDLSDQLAVEISKGHVLSGETVKTIGRRSDADDVLFALQDGRVAEVHLTWRASAETDPRWPSTTIYSSIDDWRRMSMVPDNAESSSED